MSQPMIRLSRVFMTFPGETSPAAGELSFDIAEGENVVACRHESSPGRILLWFHSAVLFGDAEQGGLCRTNMAMT